MVLKVRNDIHRRSNISYYGEDLRAILETKVDKHNGWCAISTLRLCVMGSQEGEEKVEGPARRIGSGFTFSWRNISTPTPADSFGTNYRYSYPSIWEVHSLLTLRYKT